MRKRDLRLDKYGISTNRYRELYHFCLQYPEWKDELKFKCDTVKSPNLAGTSTHSGVSDKTGELVIRREKLHCKCELIENTAKEAGCDLWEYIIKSVCYKKPVTYLRTVMGMPCGERSFYDARRYFFYLLNEKKEM